MDAKERVGVTMPLYRWFMLLGALANCSDESYYDELVDQLMAKVQP